MKPQYLAVVIASVSGPRTILIFGDLIKSPVLWRFVASCISHSLQSEFKNVKAAGWAAGDGKSLATLRESDCLDFSLFDFSCWEQPCCRQRTSGADFRASLKCFRHTASPGLAGSPFFKELKPKINLKSLLITLFTTYSRYLAQLTELSILFTAEGMPSSGFLVKHDFSVTSVSV